MTPMMPKGVEQTLFTARQTIAEWIFPESIQLRNEAERAANHDALTGLANRCALDRALPVAEDDEGIAVVLFDLNHFGKVNKLRSHAAGDWLLCEFADALRCAALAYEIAPRVFRRGGDEFVALVPTEEAEEFRSSVEVLFGAHPVRQLVPNATAVVMVSASGTVGRTFAEADARLQARKWEAKQQQQVREAQRV